MARGAKKTETKTKEVFLLPEGTLTSPAQSLFIMSKFDDAASPKYNAEIVVPKTAPEMTGLFDRVWNFANDPSKADKIKTFGQEMQMDLDGGVLVTPFIDGDKYAVKREANGKPGDIYKGCWVIRADTQFNAGGQAGPGGIAVYGEGGVEDRIDGITANDRIWSGCKVFVGVNLSDYIGEDNRTKGQFPAVKFYLECVQVSAKGERLAKGKDYSGLVKPLASRGEAGAAAPTGGRRAART